MFRGLKNNIMMFASPSMSVGLDMPYLSGPLLCGQLKKAGYKVKFYDFPLRFFEDISSVKHLNYTNKKIIEIEQKYNLENDAEFKKMHKLHKHLIKFYKKRKRFYPNQAGRILYYTLFPYNCVIRKKYIEKGKFNFNSIFNFCFDREINFYIDYLEKKIEKLIKPYDIICISKFPDHELIGIFTLARLIKEKYKNKKIILGGCCFTPIKDELKEHPEIFDLFCDYILIRDGENSIVELMEHINNKRDITKVSNLLYKKGNKVEENPELTKIDINKIAYADYSNCNFSKYYSKIPSISITLSKGCYWGKCKFCTYNSYRNYQLKTINNAIEEISYYIKKWKIQHILFTDDAIQPKYYEKLCDRIIEKSIKATFVSYAIFDEGFTKELFQKMKKAGVTRLIWGLETHSKKVFDIANKSGCFEKRAEILKNAHEAGIKNTINIIEGLPGENHKDLLETINFLHENIECVDWLGAHKFTLYKDSEFANNPEKYGIIVTNKPPFSSCYQFYNSNSDITQNNSFTDYLNSRYLCGMLRDNKTVKEAISGYLEKLI